MMIFNSQISGSFILQYAFWPTPVPVMGFKYILTLSFIVSRGGKDSASYLGSIEIESHFHFITSGGTNARLDTEDMSFT